MEIVSLKNDFCIKEVMENEAVRKHFISDVLGIPLMDIKSVQIVSPILWKRRKKEKLGILDIQLTMNDNTKINIEMQLKHHDQWENRTVFYLAKMFTADLQRGEDYKRLKKCVAITILDFQLDDRKEYHNIYMLRDKDGRLYTDILELHTIELAKPIDREQPNPLDEWHSLFNAKTEEDLDMIKLRTNNSGIIAAIKELKTISLSDRLWYMHEQYLKEKRDRKWIEDDIKRQATEEGKKQGLEEERENGIKVLIHSLHGIKADKEQIINVLMTEYGLSREEAEGKL